MKILNIIAVLIATTLITGALLVVKSDATAPEGVWSEWVDTSECIGECDQSEGVKTQERTFSKEVCDTNCPTVTFEDSRKVCPAGYYDWSSHYCEKNGNQFDLKAKIIETFTVEVVYEKSQDPNKCHKPTGASLNVPSWAMSEFAKLPEFKTGEKVDCHLEVTETETREVECTIPEEEIVACEEEPVDVCENIEGVQEVTPEGYTNNEGQCLLEEVPESTPSNEPKKHNGGKDKKSGPNKCEDIAPPLPTWFRIEDGSARNGWKPVLTWSAEGGDTTEIRFSDEPNNFKWQFKTVNDGKLVGGYVEEGNTGELGMVDYFYQMRTVNGCEESAWTETVKAFN